MQHLAYMHRAYELALQGWGKVSPNPMVGAVIVKNGRICAEGYHQRYGDTHAEVNALEKLKGKAAGATLYVTLEPCSHWGKQPPCTDAIIKSGIKEVIVGCLDPNPVNNGKSIKLLRKAGIKVTVGILNDELNRMNEVFNKYIITKRPWVITKTAQTLDGKIACLSGDSKWITSQEARDYAHHFRFGVDAILVGINTVINDNPRLNATPNKRIKKIILDTTLKTPLRAHLFSGTQQEDVFIFTSIKPTIKHAKLLRKATIITAPLFKGKVNLPWVIDYLGQHGISSVLIEGGASVVGEAIKQRLVDQMMVYVAPKIMGEGLASIKGLTIKSVKDIVKLRKVNVQPIGADILITAYLN